MPVRKTPHLNLLACSLILSAIRHSGCSQARSITPAPEKNLNEHDDAPSARNDVTSLPGVGPLDAVGIAMAAGYLDAGAPPSGQAGNMYAHYICTADASIWTDMSKPVVFWYNGGPGASSLFGLMQEFGPLLLTDDAYTPSGMQPVRNAYAWSQQAVVCAIDSPPPIGLGFCTQQGPAGPATSCGAWKDSLVFEANRNAYDTFFKDAFPEWKGRTLYLAGESYAGIYVPGFANAIMDRPIEGVPFGGLMVGDGFTGCEPQAGKPADYCVNFKNIGLFEYPNAMPGPFYDIQFFHGHSQMSESLYRSLMQTCTGAEQTGDAPISAQCQSLLDEMQSQVGYFYPYNLYDACLPRWNTSAHDFAGDKHGTNAAVRRRRTARRSSSLRSPSAGDQDGGVCSPCLGNALPDWLLQDETLAALGVIAGSRFVNTDNGEGFSYTTDQGSVGDIYLRALSLGLRVLIYEGDSDACGLQTAPIEDYFTKLFDDNGIKQTAVWRPWSLENSVQAGYRIEWLDGNATFASIRGSGHLAPLNRPAASLALFSSFVQGASLPGTTWHAA